MGYDGQHRGSAAAYAEYFAGMDRSMRHKIALTTSFFPTSGTVVDMGSGSGSGSFDLASLYTGLSVIGVDVSEAAVAHARATFRRPNLSFRLGDIADPLFPPGSIDGILNSSVLHHVTSFNGFSTERLSHLFDNQCASLREGGILVVRDFVVPAGPEHVLLDLPADDGADSGEPIDLSTAALFERFIRTFRSAAYPSGGAPLERIRSSRPDRARYRTSLRLATEFALRKDYRDSWEVELREEYLYYSQDQFERALEGRGLRIVLSKPLYNPWILKHRFRGRIELRSEDDVLLPFPPTNYVIVGEKTSAGVRLRERSSQRDPTPRYLEQRSSVGFGLHFDLVRRPLPVIDVLPWFECEGELFVVCRQGFPRPIVSSPHAAPRLDSAHVSGYINEPIVAVVSPETEARLSIEATLEERAGAPSSAVKRIEGGLSYFPSPGGTDEIVRAHLVEIDPSRGVAIEAPFLSGFGSEARIRAVAAEQYLRACQVGGMFDARLELNIYDLLLRRGRAAGPWIEAEIVRPSARTDLPVEDLRALLERRAEVRFRDSTFRSGYLEIRTAEFEELDAAGAVLSTKTFEYVLPAKRSTNTVSVLPYAAASGSIVVGLEERLLPAVEHRTGSALLLTAPAYRLPASVKSFLELPQIVAHALEEERAVTITDPQVIGGAYYPSVGLSPEQVTVLAAPLAESSTAGTLRWVRLSDVISERAMLLDGHLLIAALRLAHALSDGPFSARETALSRA